MKRTLLRRLATISVACACVLTAARVETARRPRYGGTLRVEIGVTVSSLDPAIGVVNSEEAAAKEQLDALVYDHRNADGTWAGDVGSGAFRVTAWEPGKRASLAANEDYRGGRPFVDSIEIELGRSARERLLDLELNKTDFAEIPPEQARMAADRGVRMSRSQPDELLALDFSGGRAAQNDRVREALALSIDRAVIVNFILQKTGEAAGGLLPQWSNGTAFLFRTAADVPRSKELWSKITPTRRLVLGYDSADSLEKLVAERVVVNAREAAIPVTLDVIQRSSGPLPDAILMRWHMKSNDPREWLLDDPIGARDAEEPAIHEACAPLRDSKSPERIYNCERAIVDSYGVIPLVWLPQVYGLSARVRDWKAPAPGENWPLADVWLEEAP